MCFLIFNKKIKLNNTTDIMSSIVNKNVKLETVINIPNDYVGLIFYRDKYIITLPAGNHKLQGDTFFELFEKNKRKNKNAKTPTYNFNIHYISTSRHNIEFTFTHLSSFKQKEEYFFTTLYEIENPRAFAKELLTTWYKTTNNRTLSYIKSWFKDFCYYVMEKKFDNDKSFHLQLLTLANKYFKKYGLNIIDIKLKINSENQVKESFKEVNKEENLNSPKLYINSPQNLIDKSEKYCSNCQSRINLGSDFCSNCGYKLTNLISFNNDRN